MAYNDPNPVLTGATPVLPGVRDPLLRTYQPFPHMPSTKDGKPFLDASGQPVVLHSEDEEKEFRSNNAEFAADRLGPVAAGEPRTLEEALAVIADLRRKLHDVAPDQYPEVAAPPQPGNAPAAAPGPTGERLAAYQMRYGADGKLLPDQPGVKPPTPAADPVLSKDGTIVDDDELAKADRKAEADAHAERQAEVDRQDADQRRADIDKEAAAAKAKAKAK